MVERVAMALSDAAFANTKAWDHSPEAYKVIWRQYARAAIEAMREPTPAVLNAAVDASYRDDRWDAYSPQLRAAKTLAHVIAAALGGS